MVSSHKLDKLGTGSIKGAVVKNQKILSRIALESREKKLVTRTARANIK